MRDTLPQYQCHKKVCALKIKAIAPLPEEPEYASAVCKGATAFNSSCGRCERCHWRARNPVTSAMITPEEDGYEPFEVSGEYLVKHKPTVGGYWVLYADGYQSFSPAQAFEEGYSRIESPHKL